MSYQALTGEARRQVRQLYGKDHLFRMLYKALSVHDGKSLSPEDVWCEARKAVVQIGEADEDARDIEVQALFSDLPERYGESKETDVMCVMLAVFFMLLDKHDAVEGHPFRDVCCEIKSTLKPMPGFEDLYERCREEEDKQETNGKFIEVVDYMERFLSECCVSHVVDKDDDIGWITKMVNEAKGFEVSEMRLVENLLSRINDQSNYRFQPLLDDFRQTIDEKIKTKHLPSTVNTQGGAFITGGEFQTGVEFVAQKRIESK